MVTRCHFMLLAVSVVALGVVLNTCNAEEGLRKNFYKKSCPQAENIVRDITWTKVEANPALAANLLRVHFHDCFVKGSDASILLDPVGGNNQTEKNAVPNLTLAGFDVIDDIKTQLEKTCPGIVSCADILTLSARDAVSFQFKRALWDVLTGRRDGNESLPSNTNGNIPSPFSNFTTQAQIFAKKGLNVNDLVVLSGAHTIGVARCGTFSRRLYNFTGKGDSDPALNATYAASLRTQCPNPANPAATTTSVEMDPQSSLSFDTHYYDILVQNQVLFQSDAALLTNKASTKVVQSLRSKDTFFSEFGKSMKKMGNIEVLVGTAGHIRNQCRVVLLTS